ncbi:hypothetical protein BDV93DRAFT_610640 [Ceratobasidium sp. AG-I]|nr:hypothetical protein BDV93DRAFT_610640 [Ceratobasidium sp. AG-I]
MQNELIPYQHDISSYLYVGDVKRFSESVPTHDEVKVAINAFCPFDPVTGDMLAKKSISSLHVLNKILYLPFYPDLLGLLTTPIFVAKCLMDIEKYLERHKLFDKAYGLLLLKILSLGNMAGILDQADQLGSFINSMLWLKLKSQKNTFDITADLVHKTVSILQHRMNTWRGFVDLSFWNYGINITIDGQPKHERYFTAERSQLLLDHLWEQRDLMVTTFAKSPTPGFSAVLLVMSSNELRRDFANQEFVHLIPRSRDLFARYTLVATLEENAVIQDQSRTSSTHHLAPVNLEDHRAMARLLTQQLLSTDQPDSFSAGYAAFILFQFSHSLRIDMAYELGIPVMEAGFQFFWRVCLDPERREEMWHEGGPYALQPVMLFSDSSFKKREIHASGSFEHTI